MLSSHLRWLSAETPTTKKHTTLLHPLATFLVHYAVVAGAVILAHDFLIAAFSKIATKYYDDNDVINQYEADCSHNAITTVNKNTAHFLLVYFICFFAWRLFIHRDDPPFYLYCELYRQTFLCSVTIFNASLAYYLNRPVIATAFCVAVGIDQVLWYIDLSAYFVCGKFPIGVTKYLFWPGTSWASRLSSTHHLWTMPLCIWASNGVHVLCLPLSFFIVVVNVLLSRWMAPRSIIYGDHVHYLNLNLSHEFWPDVKVQFLIVYLSKGWYIVRLCWGWFIFNSLIFGLLRLISSQTLGNPPTLMCYGR